MTLGHNNLTCTELCFCIAEKSFYNPDIEKIKEIKMKIISDYYLCSISFIELLAFDFSGNVLHMLPLICQSPALIFAHV